MEKWQGRKDSQEEKEIREITEEVEEIRVLLKQYSK